MRRKKAGGFAQQAPYPNCPSVAPMYSPAFVAVARHSCEPSITCAQQPSLSKIISRLRVIVA